MPGSFHGVVEYVSGGTVVRLAGVIDEENDLGDLTRQVPAGRVFVDVGEITRMNSLGLRKWIYWIQELEGRGAEPVLVRCSRPVVLQLNQIHNFAGTRGIVASFQLPYFCSRCKREQNVVVAPGDLAGPPWQVPEVRCENCDHLMEFDDVPDAYFEFLGRVRPPDERSGPSLAASLAGLTSPVSRSSGQRMAVRDPTNPTRVLGAAGPTAETAVIAPGAPPTPSRSAEITVPDVQVPYGQPEPPPPVPATPFPRTGTALPLAAPRPSGQQPAVAPPPSIAPPPHTSPPVRAWLIILVASAIIAAAILAWGLLR